MGDTYIHIFTMELFRMAELRNHRRCPTMDEYKHVPWKWF
jgi:hypothetical protein